MIKFFAQKLKEEPDLSFFDLPKTLEKFLSFFIEYQINELRKKIYLKIDTKIKEKLDLWFMALYLNLEISMVNYIKLIYDKNYKFKRKEFPKYTEAKTRLGLPYSKLLFDNLDEQSFFDYKSSRTIPIKIIPFFIFSGVEGNIDNEKRFEILDNFYDLFRLNHKFMNEVVYFFDIIILPNKEHKLKMDDLNFPFDFICIYIKKDTEISSFFKNYKITNTVKKVAVVFDINKDYLEITRLANDLKTDLSVVESDYMYKIFEFK